MKQLTETAMFRQLSTKGAFDLSETVLKPMYDDFAHAVINLCLTTQSSNVPAYFTLHYTLSELEQLLYAANVKGEGEKLINQHLPS